MTTTPDEFTAHRLKHIAKIFCATCKAKGRKAGAVYLNSMNIKEEHYPLVREHIQNGLAKLGLTL